MSGNQKVRVLLAQALFGNPDILILDEPTNGLDPNQIRAIRRLIQDLGQEHTILLSTHILSEVEMTCNKVVIIDEGRVKAADSPLNLISSMRRAGRVTMELKIAPEVGETVLPTLDNVTKVTSEPLQDGWTRFSVFVAPNTDTRIRLAALAAEKGWPLRSLARRNANLEEVFVELTRKD